MCRKYSFKARLQESFFAAIFEFRPFDANEWITNECA